MGPIDFSMGLRGVLGAGIRSEGREQSMVVYARPGSVRPDMLERHWGGLTVTVVHTGLFRKASRPTVPSKQSRSGRVRPLMPGISIGHYKTTSGTLGAILRDARTGAPLILSNNHVLANSSRLGVPRALVGDPVLQPGRTYGSSLDDQVGSLLRYVPLNLEYAWTHPPIPPKSHKPNLVDAAVASISRSFEYDPRVLEIGEISGVAVAEVGMKVRKSGLMTGVTEGVVDSINARIRIDFDRGFYGEFADQIICSLPVAGGDSGSIILDEENRALGMLVASAPQIAVASPFETILRLLSATL